MNTLPLKEITRDPALRYRLHAVTPQLERSIQLSGIMTPVVVTRGESGWLLLDGHLRLDVAHKIPLETIPVTVVPDIATGLLQSVWVNHAQEPLSVVEKARVRAVLAQFISDERLQEVLQFLDVPTRRMQQLLLEIANYPLEVQQYFHEQQFSLKQIERLRSLKIEKLLPWIELARQLRIKAPEFQQIIEMVWDISVREDCSIEACYRYLNVDQLLEGQWTVQQKVQRLKQYLMEHRFPLLTRMRKLLEQRSQPLQRLSPVPLRIQWDRNLEEMGIWLQFFVEDVQDIKKLEDLMKNPEFLTGVKQLLETFTQTKE